jgi:hypothetical protein
VRITPRIDGRTTLINPWPGEKLVAVENGRLRELEGHRIPLELAKGSDLLISPASRPLKQLPAYEADPNKPVVFHWKPTANEVKPRSLSIIGDQLPHEPSTVNFGPYSPDSAEDLAAHFLPNGQVNRFGANNVVPERITFSPENGGSLSTELPAGRAGKLQIAFVNGKDKDESVYLRDFDMAADFVPKPSTQFGFCFGQMALHGDGVYFAVLSPIPGGKSALIFGLNGTDLSGSATSKKIIPLEMPVEPGTAYRMRLEVRHVKGLPMRYADAVLTVAKAAEPEKTLAEGSVRLNLSNDNMSDIGQAGLFFLGGFPAGSKEPSGFTANRISIQSKP